MNDTKPTPAIPSGFYITTYDGYPELYHQCHSLDEAEEGEYVAHVDSGTTLEKLVTAATKHVCEATSD